MTYGNQWESNGWDEQSNGNGWGERTTSWDSNAWTESHTEKPLMQPQSQQQPPQQRQPEQHLQSPPLPSGDSQWAHGNWNAPRTEEPKKDDDQIRIVKGKNGTNKVDSWRTFEEVRKYFPGGLVDILTDGKVANFKKPTNIQAYSWPSLMQGEDIIGVAKTGSGKTLAFLLPGFIRVKQMQHDPYRLGPKILVLAPTRELCQQIYEESEKFGEPAEIYSACAYGGADRNLQLRKFRSGPHVAIGCPGRLLDYLERGNVRVSNADYFVLDEADRMLDMGFEPQIRSIIKYLPDVRQSLLFSATWPKEVQQIARSICYKDSVHIQVGTSDSLTANADITQHVVFVDSEGEKWQQLQTALATTYRKTDGKGGALIFTATKRGCADLARSIKEYLQCPASALHGDMEQSARDYALQRFKDGQDMVLVATDVAQRGLDVRNVAVVVNWDAPNNAEDYVHRIGRTGRAGDHGDAYTFLFKYENQKAKNIMKIMQKCGQEIPAELLQVSHCSMPMSSMTGSQRSRYGSGKGSRKGGW